MDIVDQKTRSRMMSGIRGKHTRPELIVRKFLHAQGFRFRLHVKDLPGKPDIVLPKYRACIFVHGCFWHRHANCRYATMPSTRVEFWQKKFDETIKRDRRTIEALEQMGWKIIEVWECQLKESPPELNWLVQALAPPHFHATCQTMTIE